MERIEFQTQYYDDGGVFIKALCAQQIIAQLIADPPGYIQEGEFGVLITGINVDSRYRRCGIASALVGHLRDVYPNMSLFGRPDPQGHGIHVSGIIQFNRMNGIQSLLPEKG